MASFVGLTALAGLCVLVVTYVESRSSTRDLADQLFRSASEQAAVRTRAHLGGPVPLLESMAMVAADSLPIDDTQALAHELAALLRANPGLTWLSFSDPNGRFVGAHRVDRQTIRINHSHITDGRTAMAEYDLDPSGGQRPFRQVADSGYDPRTRPFYQRAVAAGRLIWVPPYLFFDEMVPGVSAAAPAYRKNGELVGVFTADFDLIALSRFVSQLSISPDSRFFLFDSEGTLVAYPDFNLASALSSNGALLRLDDVPDPLVQSFSRARAAQPPATGSFQSLEMTLGGKRYLASASTFSAGGDLKWTVGAIAPEDDFLAPAQRAQTTAAIAAAATVALAALLAALMAQRISRAVMSLLSLMRRVRSGDMDAHAELSGSREFRELSAGFNDMVTDLRDRIRLRHDLSIAVDVQRRLLPMHPPEIRGVDIAGHSTYCDETGGDYFDFIPLASAEKPCCMVVLGDVMGHGIAAALVMAGARAVIRDRAASGATLADIAGRVNHLLCTDLAGSHFMTMHCSILDPNDRVFRWISAGHDPAFIYDPASDRFVELPDRGDYPLGVDGDARFHERRVGPLPESAIIVVGTDGIWEARNSNDEQFGKERLCEIIRNAAREGRSAEELTQSVLRGVGEHRGTLPQHDDLTLVVVRLLTTNAHTQRQDGSAESQPLQQPVAAEH